MQDANRITHVHQPQPPAHSYQVPYCPKGCADSQENWPTIRVRASDAEQAQQLAAWTTCSPVGDATRIDD